MKEKCIHEDHRSRMRQRFHDSPDSLAKHELVELLLFYAIPRRNVNDEAHRLIDKYGSVSQILHADIDSLSDVEGIGNGAATFLSLIGKIIDTINKEQEESVVLFNFENAKTYFTEILSKRTTETLCAVYLAKDGRMLLKETYTNNSISDVEVDTTPFSKAISRVNPHAVVIAHNHPSGNPKPSANDDVATEKLATMFLLHGVKLYDHVIVAGKKVYSYNLDGRLEPILRSAYERCKGL